MYLGTQFRPRDDDDLRVFAQLGVRHVCVDPPPARPGQTAHDWTRDQLIRHRDRLDGFGLILDMVELPLKSNPIERSESPDILRAGPDRDRQIDSICRIIENVAAAGVPAVKYNMNIIGIPRTEPEPGRGGAACAAFRWDRAEHDAPAGGAGALDEEENWARIEYFLQRVVPVAEANRVRLACHPHDPYTPPGWRGVTRVLGTVEGLKRFVQTCENPWHGLNFCQGTVGEMMEDPAREIDAVIRWFGERDKLFNVHFRNIVGRRLDFREAFPDEGDMDMAASMRVYAEVGYKYMMMPDHAPTLAGRDPEGAAFAFCYGYIAGAMQAMGVDPAGPDSAPL